MAMTREAQIRQTACDWLHYYHLTCTQDISSKRSVVVPNGRTLTSRYRGLVLVINCQIEHGVTKWDA